MGEQIQMEPVRATCVNTGFGPITVFADDGAVVAVEFGEGADARDVAGDALLAAARDQIREYFTGTRTGFDLPLAPVGTDFQRRVWDALGRIGYGETLTYGELARRLGSSPRAVGGALARNPIPVLIPCHRVTGAGGRLTGYTGGEGVETKRRLLVLEGVGQA